MAGQRKRAKRWQLAHSTPQASDEAPPHFEEQPWSAARRCAEAAPQLVAGAPRGEARRRAWRTGARGRGHRRPHQAGTLRNL